MRGGYRDGCARHPMLLLVYRFTKYFGQMVSNTVDKTGGAFLLCEGVAGETGPLNGPILVQQHNQICLHRGPVSSQDRANSIKGR